MFIGQAPGEIWLDEVSCNGTENLLSECDSSGVGEHDCSHWEDAGVLCSDDFVLRLVNSEQILKAGQNVSEGRLEVICLFVCLFVVLTFDWRCIGVPRRCVGDDL